MGLSSRSEAIGMSWQRARRARSAERAERRLRAAEENAELAAARYQALRAAASAPGTGSDGPAPRGPLPTWQQLLLLVVGGGLLAGLLVIWLLAAAYVGPAALLVLVVCGGLATGLTVLRRRRRPPVPTPRRRPCVADLVRAAQELQDAEVALRRAKGDEQDGPSAPAQDPAPAVPLAPRPRMPWPGAPQT